MKITDNLIQAIMCLPLNRHFSWWTKMNGTQRRAVLSPWRMHCMYSGMAKGTTCWKRFGLIWRLFWAWFYLTNTATSSCERSEAGFWVIFFRGPRQTLVIPTIQYYCIVWSLCDNTLILVYLNLSNIFSSLSSDVKGLSLAKRGFHGTLWTAPLLYFNHNHNNSAYKKS